MFTLFKALSNLFSPSYAVVHDRDEAFLAEAVDMRDLEQRMHLLDTGRHSLFAPGPHGVFAA